MLKQKMVITIAAGALTAGVGVASAFADTPPGGTTNTVTTTTSTNSEQGDQQDGQQGVDEQGAANDVADAATDVQNEANNTGADDQSGDQADNSQNG